MWTRFGPWIPQYPKFNEICFAGHFHRSRKSHQWMVVISIKPKFVSMGHINFMAANFFIDLSYHCIFNETIPSG